MVKMNPDPKHKRKTGKAKQHASDKQAVTSAAMSKSQKTKGKPGKRTNKADGGKSEKKGGSKKGERKSKKSKKMNVKQKAQARQAETESELKKQRAEEVSDSTTEESECETSAPEEPGQDPDLLFLPVRSNLSKPPSPRTRTAAEGDRVRHNPICQPIVYGTIAWWLGRKADENASHKWTIFVRGVDCEDLSHFLEKVVFILHPSFSDHKRVVDKPPFELMETGWGEFEIQIQLHFRDENEPHIQIFQMLKLYPDGQGANAPSSKKPVVNEVYDEIVFNRPSPQFAARLLKGSSLNGFIDGHAERRAGGQGKNTRQPTQKPTHQLVDLFTDFNEDTQIQQLMAAQNYVTQEISTLQRQLGILGGQPEQSAALSIANNTDTGTLPIVTHTAISALTTTSASCLKGEVNTAGEASVHVGQSTASSSPSGSIINTTTSSATSPMDASLTTANVTTGSATDNSSSGNNGDALPGQSRKRSRTVRVKGNGRVAAEETSHKRSKVLCTNARTVGGVVETAGKILPIEKPEQAKLIPPNTPQNPHGTRGRRGKTQSKANSAASNTTTRTSRRTSSRKRRG